MSDTTYRTGDRVIISRSINNKEWRGKRGQIVRQIQPASRCIVRVKGNEGHFLEVLFRADEMTHEGSVGRARTADEIKEKRQEVTKMGPDDASAPWKAGALDALLWCAGVEEDL